MKKIFYPIRIVCEVDLMMGRGGGQTFSDKRAGRRKGCILEPQGVALLRGSGAWKLKGEGREKEEGKPPKNFSHI